MSIPFHMRDFSERDEILRAFHEMILRQREAKKRGDNTEVEAIRQEIDQHLRKYQLGAHFDE